MRDYIFIKKSIRLFIDVRISCLIMFLLIFIDVYVLRFTTYLNSHFTDLLLIFFCPLLKGGLMMYVIYSGFPPKVVHSPCNFTAGLTAFTLDMLLQSSPNGISLSLGYLPASSSCPCGNLTSLFSHYQITAIIRRMDKNPVMVGPVIIAHLSSSQIRRFFPLGLV